MAGAVITSRRKTQLINHCASFHLRYIIGWLFDIAKNESFPKIIPEIITNEKVLCRLRLRVWVAFIKFFYYGQKSSEKRKIIIVATNDAARLALVLCDDFPALLCCKAVSLVTSWALECRHTAYCYCCAAWAIQVLLRLLWSPPHPWHLWPTPSPVDSCTDK